MRSPDPFAVGSLVTIASLPGIRAGSVGRITAKRWKTENKSFLVSVWLPSCDCLIECYESSLKPYKLEANEANAKRWRK